MNKKLVITQYTDPICIWCYAMDAGIRKVEFLLGDKVDVRSVLGMLVSDVREIIGDDTYSTIRFEKLRSQMKEHFRNASLRGGIPVSTLHMDSVRPEDITSLPASLAVEAMKLIDEEKGERYLRRIREAFHSDDLNTSAEDVLVSLAVELGADSELFKEKSRSSEAAAMLESDTEASRSAGVNSFPTTLISYGSNSRLVTGYVDYETLRNVISEVSDGELVLEEVSFNMAAVDSYMSLFGRVTAHELAVAFSLSSAELSSLVDKLISTGLYEREDRGSSFFIKEKSIGFCDAVTGVCSIGGSV